MNFKQALRSFLITLPVVRNMNKRIQIIIPVLLISTCINAQFDTSFIKSNLRRCADSLTLAFKSRDWDKFTRYTYPALIGSIGSVSEFKTYIASTFGQIPDSAWKKYEPGKILQVIKHGKDFEAVIELKTIINYQGYRTTATTHLVGQSWDGGMFWMFFDTQGDRRATKIIYPNLSDELIIPKRDEKQERLF